MCEARPFRAIIVRMGERVELITEITDLKAQRAALDAGFTRESVRRRVDRCDEVVWARLPGDPPGPARRPLPELPDGLTDGDLTLRPLRLADVDDLLALFSLPEVQAATPTPMTLRRSDMVRRCTNAPSEWLAGNRADLTIRVDDTFAGDIGLYNEAWSGQAMVGYSMRPEFRGRGIATRAVRLLATWAFDIGIGRLVAGTLPHNHASQRVLAKAGFTRESIQKARFNGPNGTRIDDILHVRLP